MSHILKRYVNLQPLFHGSFIVLLSSLTVQVSEIVDVRRGWKTDTFNRFGNKVVGAQRKMKAKAESKAKAQARAKGGAKGSFKGSCRGRDADYDDVADVEPVVIKPLVDEACCFSVVYGDTRSSLDLVASSPQVSNSPGF